MTSIYKITIKGSSLCYIGSTKNINGRISAHKFNASNLKKVNKLYTTIRDFGGWINCEVHVLAVCSEKHFQKGERFRLERFYFEAVEPHNRLNQNVPSRTAYEYFRGYYRTNKEHLTKKYACSCGGFTCITNRFNHEKTKKHLKSL